MVFLARLYAHGRFPNEMNRQNDEVDAEHQCRDVGPIREIITEQNNGFS